MNAPSQNVKAGSDIEVVEPIFLKCALNVASTSIAARKFGVSEASKAIGEGRNPTIAFSDVSAAPNIQYQ